MSELLNERCDACRADAPRVEEPECKVLLQQLDGWQLIEQEGVAQLLKVYEFGNFVDALAFTQQVGGLAEQEGHHPALLTEWGRVTVRWWTHKIRGLHRNDFIMAAKTDDIAN